MRSAAVIFVLGFRALSFVLRFSAVIMAESQGFEPWLRFPANTLSKRAPSATRPTLLYVVLAIVNIDQIGFQAWAGMALRPKLASNTALAA